MSWVVTGGAGFIGTNLVKHLVETGHTPVVLDDLSREGVDINAEFLYGAYGVRTQRVDVSDREALWSALDSVGGIEHISHLAGQVSFLNSIENPMRDFEVNALGTLNVLEYVRTRSPETTVVGMSSNKIYGDLADVRVIESETRYVAPDFPNGFSETLLVDCHGPYGCSKGLADQYLADYGRIYGLRTASFRQSSVYGPHQHPRSDQGWVAHLVSEAIRGRTVLFSGVGKQVRDLLHASDLARLLVDITPHLASTEHRQFNVGGGIENALSLLEVLSWITEATGRTVTFETGPFRPSDQMVFVSDNSRIANAAGWHPLVRFDDGLARLLNQTVT